MNDVNEIHRYTTQPYAKGAAQVAQ